MSLILFAVIGFVVGSCLEMSRAGYVTMALTSVGFSSAQIIHLLITKNRAMETLLPLVVGIVLVLFMLLGALVRFALCKKPRAAQP